MCRRWSTWVVGLGVDMKEKEHQGGSFVALKAGELERALWSSLYEHAQKNSWGLLANVRITQAMLEPLHRIFARRCARA